MPDTQLEKDQKTLRELIATLPTYNAAVAPKQVTSPEVRKTEEKVLALVQTYTVNDALSDIAAKKGDATKLMERIAQGLTSLNASEPQQARVPAKDRIAALQSDEKVKALVTRIVDLYDPKTGKMKDDKKAIEALQADIAAATLPDRKNARALLGEGKDSVLAAAQEKRMQITESGRLFTLSTVREGGVAGQSNYQDTFRSFARHNNEDKMKGVAFRIFMEQLDKAGGKEPLAKDKNGKVTVFDIGPDNAAFTAQALEQIGKYTGGVGNIRYTAVERNKSAIPQAEATLANMKEKPASVQIEAKLFGRKELDGYLKEKEITGTAGVVLASHVYNLGDQFVRQTRDVAAKNGVVYIQHEFKSDIIDFRTQEKFKGKFRASGSDLTAGISADVKKDDTKEYTFTMRSTLAIPRISDEEWKLMESMETGVFNKEYKVKDAKQQAAFTEKRNIIEFVLMAPLPSFTREERKEILGDLRKKLEANDYKLNGQVKTQLVLGRGHDKALETALEKAAKGTQAELDKLDGGKAKEDKKEKDQPVSMDGVPDVLKAALSAYLGLPQLEARAAEPELPTLVARKGRAV